MSIITSHIKGLLSIKIKYRHDCYTDQFTRIFMTKMYLIASLVASLDWFHDTVACMVPKDSDLTQNFVHAACWIQGFYVYPEMIERLFESNYYGIPKNMDFDGLAPNGDLCQTHTRQGLLNIGCEAMKKRYYLEYQWLPFFIASLAVLVYVPYIFFRIVNTDIISLKDSICKEKVNKDEIVNNFFNYNINPLYKMRIRLVLNALVKLLYVVVNVTAFRFTDLLLGNNFQEYGIKWLKWAQLNHSEAYDFFEGEIPKPGNVLLPSFGFCEIQEARMDIRHVFFNRNKFICEISANILYQYVLLVLWFIMVIAISVSILGVCVEAVRHVIEVSGVTSDIDPSHKVFKTLSMRECQYLVYIRNKNMPLYGEILRRLKLCRKDAYAPNGIFSA